MGATRSWSDGDGDGDGDGGRRRKPDADCEEGSWAASPLGWGPARREPP